MKNAEYSLKYPLIIKREGIRKIVFVLALPIYYLFILLFGYLIVKKPNWFWDFYNEFKKIDNGIYEY